MLLAELSVRPGDPHRGAVLDGEREARLELQRCVVARAGRRDGLKMHPNDSGPQRVTLMLQTDEHVGHAAEAQVPTGLNQRPTFGDVDECEVARSWHGQPHRAVQFAHRYARRAPAILLRVAHEWVDEDAESPPGEAGEQVRNHDFADGERLGLGLVRGGVLEICSCQREGHDRRYSESRAIVHGTAVMGRLAPGPSFVQAPTTAGVDGGVDGSTQDRCCDPFVDDPLA